MRTLKELAKEALDVQDACNLSGVVHAFSRAMTDLGQHVQGTEARNRHPVAILYASKIASLTGCEDSAPYWDAYNWAQAQTKG